MSRKSPSVRLGSARSARCRPRVSTDPATTWPFLRLADGQRQLWWV